MSSNWISVRRVKFQEIDEKGQPVGEPTFGILAADDLVQAYNDTYADFKSLEEDIADHGMLALASGSTDFGVPEDHAFWKGHNYAGVKLDYEEKTEDEDE